MSDHGGSQTIAKFVVIYELIWGRDSPKRMFDGGQAETQQMRGMQMPLDA